MCTVYHKCSLRAEVYSNFYSRKIVFPVKCFTLHNLIFIIHALLQFLHNIIMVSHLVLVHSCRLCKDSLVAWEMIISKSSFYKLNSSWLSKTTHLLYPGLQTNGHTCSVHFNNIGNIKALQHYISKCMLLKIESFADKTYNMFCYIAALETLYYVT